MISNDFVIVKMEPIIKSSKAVKVHFVTNVYIECFTTAVKVII